MGVYEMMRMTDPLRELVTSSEPRDRESEAMKARARFEARRPTAPLRE